MGNRAVMTFGKGNSKIGIYLHWNGGIESVEAFLKAGRTLKLRANDESYCVARMCQIIGNYMGDSVLSLGVGHPDTMDRNNGNNGEYLIGDDLTIVGRKYAPKGEKIDQAKSDEIYKEVMAVNELIFEPEEALCG